MKRQTTLDNTASISTTGLERAEAPATAQRFPRAQVISIEPQLPRILDPNAVAAVQRHKTADNLFLAVMIAGFCAFTVTLATSILYPAMQTLVH